MKVTAKFVNNWWVSPLARLVTQMSGYEIDETYTLNVKSHPLGALKYRLPKIFGNVPSIEIETHFQCSGESCGYAEISDFLDCWKVQWADTRTMRLPFVRQPFGLGDAFAFFAERLPLRLKMIFNGCEDRRAWWNLLLQFVPLGWRTLTSVEDLHRINVEHSFLDGPASILPGEAWMEIEK